MSSEIERRLEADARRLDGVTLSPDAERGIDARLALTPQVRPAPPRRLPGWPALAAAAAGFVVVTAIALLWQPASRDAEDTVPVAAVTVPSPADVGTPLAPAQALPIQVPLQRVSHAAPLEAEWVALRADLERARDQIERDLPVRF